MAHAFIAKPIGGIRPKMDRGTERNMKRRSPTASCRGAFCCRLSMTKRNDACKGDTKKIPLKVELHDKKQPTTHHELSTAELARLAGFEPATYRFVA